MAHFLVIVHPHSRLYINSLNLRALKYCRNRLELHSLMVVYNASMVSYISFRNTRVFPLRSAAVVVKALCLTSTEISLSYEPTGFEGHTFITSCTSFITKSVFDSEDLTVHTLAVLSYISVT